MTALNFYTYRQNNSGGWFQYDPDKGISVNVIVQATSEHEADQIAESIGLYFDGDGDCSCCGDRWYGASSYDLSENVPKVHDEDVTAEGWQPHMQWVDGFDTFVHYADGHFEGFPKMAPEIEDADVHL